MNRLRLEDHQSARVTKRSVREWSRCCSETALLPSFKSPPFLCHYLHWCVLVSVRVCACTCACHVVKETIGLIRVIPHRNFGLNTRLFGGSGVNYNKGSQSAADEALEIELLLNPPTQEYRVFHHIAR